VSTPSGPYTGEPYPPQQPYSDQPFGVQQPYPQPYPGAPNPYPGAPLPPQRGTNGFAIAALILSIFGAVLLSVIFGFVALSQIKRNGQGGRGMAIAGLVISGVWILIIVVAILAAILSPPSTTTPSATAPFGSTPFSSAPVSSAPLGGSTAGQRTLIDDLTVGECVSDLGQPTSTRSVTVVPCTEPHVGELYAIYQLDKQGPYPGRDAVHSLAEQGCNDRAAAYAPTAFNDATIGIYMLVPIEAGWSSGDRTTDCFAKTTTPRSGSIKGQ
jgi:hypothetical protein